MPNSIDFRADQIQTKQIIVTGSGAGTTKLLIYGIEAQGSPVNEGVVNQTVFPTSSIGSDVFLYVSGALNTKGSATVRGTSVFGGDLVVSGSLYNGSVPAAGNRGIYSHAEGLSTLASGAYSHAEGRETSAIGSGSHAEGYGGAGYASGNYSHAEGQATIAYGAGSHAEGYQTNASGDYCHAEGQDTYVTTLGDYSHAEGHLTKVDNRYAHAEGYGTLASGLYAHAEGYLTTGSGQASHAEGQNTTAGGAYSHTEGKNTYTFDRGSSFPTQRGSGSHAEGEEASATGNFSHAEGYQAAASGAWSHAEGRLATASGLYSHAEGNGAVAVGYASHAEGFGGNGFFASGAYSHVEGQATITYGESSHAEGYLTVAFGPGSHASGIGTIASGSTAALSNASIVQAATGRWNKRNNTTSLFVVGNGTGDSDALRGDIFRAESTGQLVLSGGISHKAKYYGDSSADVNLLKSDYLVIVNVQSQHRDLYLPEITDLVSDIGLTVRIVRNSTLATSFHITVAPNINNSGFEINYFGITGPNMAIPYGLYTMNSVTLTYMGVLSGVGRWFLTESSYT